MKKKQRRFWAFMKKKNLNPMNNRKKVGIILFATSIGLFFLFAFRFSYVVVTGKVGDTVLSEKTKELYKGSSVVKAKRGSILDRYGNPIAQDATSYSIYAILSEKQLGIDKEKLYVQEKDYASVAETLAEHLKSKGMTKEKALEVLKDDTLEDGTKKFQVEFGNAGKNINLETKQAIEADLEEKGIKGINFEEHPARSYPNGIFSSHFIGYAQYADAADESKGLEGVLGLEAAYDDVLSGTDGKIIYEKDRYQNPLPGTVKEEIPAEDGQDIYTTLDSRLQIYLESLMDPVAEKYEPENLTAILMEAETGDILAMSQRPTFNPETKEGINDDTKWSNLFVQDQYEPGSTMKIFTTAAALNEKLFTPDETFVGGEIKVYDATINDHDYGVKGILTFRQALSWSSNNGMVRLEQRLKDDGWRDYLGRFGFGQSTNSGLMLESAGTLPTDNAVDMAMSSFGQAINVTNFQMMRAFSAIANDGQMLQPHYIRKIVNTDTEEEKIVEPEVLGQPVTSETANEILTYMIDTVEDPNYGSAYGLYSVEGYHIAAKTGTAQVADPNTGSYMRGESDYTYSVVEMAPAEDPKYILYITMKLPKEYTSTAISEIANPMLKRVLETDEITDYSQETSTIESVKVNDYRNLSPDEAASSAREQILEPVIIGDGEKVTAQSTKAGETLMPNQKIIFMTDGTKYMPDVTKWSKNDLMKLGEMLGVETTFEGQGYASEQSIPAGTEITGDSIKFTLSPD